MLKLGEAEKRAIRSRLAVDRSESATTTGTFRTSVVAAYPSMNNCRIGAAITIPNNRRSSLSSMSSFQIRKPTRRMLSAPLPLEPRRCDREDREGKAGERSQRGPIRVEPGAFQHNRPQSDQKISGRN